MVSLAYCEVSDCFYLISLLSLNLLPAFNTFEVLAQVYDDFLLANSVKLTFTISAVDFYGVIT